MTYLEKLLDIYEENLMRFKYKNWKGEISDRAVHKNSMVIYFGEVEWHQGKQWLMKAYDIDKHDDRIFALKDFIYVYDEDLTLGLN